MNVRWSDAALEELGRLVARFQEVAPAYGDRLLERVFQAADRLALFPESGRVVPEFGLPELREVIIRLYRLLYGLGPEGIEIHAVFHGAMQLNEPD